MITDADESYILDRAYVPEHIVSLMVLISKAEPFFIRDCLCYAKDNWAIVIGYPLSGPFVMDSLNILLHEVSSRFKPEYLWIAAPEIPEEYLQLSNETEYDT